MTIQGIVKEGLTQCAATESQFISKMTSMLCADKTELILSDVKKLLRDAAPGFNKIVQC